MPRKALREDLEHLHRELAEGAELDPDARALLAELSGDIERLLAEDEPGAAAAPLADRLRAATERFEESHPALTAVVGRLAETLSNLGI